MTVSATPRARILAALLVVGVCGGAFGGPPLDEIWCEDWEGGIGSWYASNGVWQVGLPAVGPDQSHSVPNCAGTVLAGDYPSYADTRLVSPQITLPSVSGGEQIWVRFWHWFMMEDGDDTGRVQISTNNGVTWDTVSHVVFEGASGVWTRAAVNISDYAGQTVRLGFYFTSDYSYQYAGWYIDDICIAVDTFSFPVPSSEDFESGVGDWSADNGLWGVGVPLAGPSDPHSGLRCAGTVLQGNYYPHSNTRLVSPRIALPTLSPGQRVWVKFWQWFVTENGDDQGRVQVSTDDGVTWTTLSDPVYEGTSNVWTQAAVDLSSYAGQTVRLGFYLTSDYSYEYAGWYIDDVSLEVSSFSLPVPGIEDFESGIGDWSVDNGLWQVGTPLTGPSNPHSGSRCAGTVLQGNYESYSNTRLVSPRIQLPELARGERIWVKFWQWFVMENGDDLGRVQISTDNGATWMTLSDPVYEGSSGLWTQVALDISDYAGMTVRLAFYFTSDYSYEYVGWYVDDVSLEVGTFSLPVSGCEDFESGIGDWSADNGLWEVGTPLADPGGAHSGVRCAGTVLQGNYYAYSNTRLVSPRIELPVLSRGLRMRVRFWQWFLTEDGDDLGRLQVSTDDGATWVTLTDPAYEGTSQVWSLASANVTAYSGMTVRLGFYFTSDYSYEYAGWYVDDVSIDVGYFGLDPTDPESFELGIGDWSVDNGLWEVGTPGGGPGTGHTGALCAGTVLGDNYPSHGNTRLVSPYISLAPEGAGTPELFFWHWFRTETGDDILKVQIRPYGGTWLDLDVPGSPFSGDARQWTQAYADLSAYANTIVQIGFYFTSDYSTNYEGWYIDDVRIEHIVNDPVDGALCATLTESGSVMLRWTIDSLAGVESLNIYRSTSPDGESHRVNESPIEARSPGCFEDATVWPETVFWYELRVLHADGSEEAVGHLMASVATGGRLATELHAAVPNPSTGATEISFDLRTDAASVSLVVYNVRGQLVRTLWSGSARRGPNAVRWDGCDDRGLPAASGVYFYRLDTGRQVLDQKMVLMR